MTPAPLEATIDLSAIAHNVGVVADRAGSAVMAVVKADGYGHGAVPVAQAAIAAGATDLGVATVAEALSLRAAGIDTPVTAWLHTPSTDFVPAVAAGVDIAVSSVRQLQQVLAAACALSVPAVVSVKVDTGLSRNGVAPAEWDALRGELVTAVAHGSIRLRAMMCHLARGDEPDHPLNDLQAARLDACVADLARAGVTPELVHIANSAAALARPDLARDLVRAGIALYGFSPLPHDHGLIPAMTLSAEVSSVKRVCAGQGVSYGHTWTADRDTRLALLPAGYADGVPRLLSNRIEVSIGGRRYPGVGRICMDQMVVDVGLDSDVHEGDRAELFGVGHDSAPTARTWADLIGTIDYEIITGIRGRTVRRYVGEVPGRATETVSEGEQTR
ncbi:alanine racemase [Williamsia sp. CHRR-6]|uniref:alanine racemase n=1 Tax=Williamsia sp. CHRR-6 TaxID=2835871 RepID=UPI001BDA5A96|nr:alanine racemase [Williamsia sp. CHRR-6]MBT0566748.1 alanine racemase [Williamsia sp. CHRR-6]